jgi:ABC-type sugar transport system, periplasmic component
MRNKVQVGVVLAAMILVAACGGEGTAPAADVSGTPSIDLAALTGEITFLTNRTDLVTDGTMKKYAQEFNRTYPNVTVKFEGITDYEGDVKTRMKTENYGDVLLIPNVIPQSDYPKYFESLGTSAEIGKKYQYTSKADVYGKVYGIPGFSSANGLVYNKAVWSKAGITRWPRTPGEFLADLQAIKDKTGAIPYYTNYKDGWPLTQWTSVVGSPSCDAWANDKLAASSNPWMAGSDLNIGDSLLFDIVKRKLSENDPTTTNWEASKGRLATGKIASMWLGSWAIVQMRDAAKKAGKDPAIIGYMPFPAQVNGKFCAMVFPDYQYAINVHSDNKIAARAWLTWLVDKSGFAESNQEISSLRGAPLPNVLKPYSAAGVHLVELSQRDSGKVNAIDKISTVGLAAPHYRRHLIDIARGASGGSLNGVFSGLATKWADAMKMAE